MVGFALVAIASSALATFAIVWLAQPVMNRAPLVRALAVAAAAAAITIGVGVGFGIATPQYLIGISAFTVPVLVLLEIAALGSGADGIGRWVLMLTWGVIVFPIAALVPLWLTASCAGTDCELQDFGGALPLIVSSSAFVLLAWLPAGVVERPTPAWSSALRTVVALLLLWVAFIAWMAQLEGAVDDFIPQILASCVIGPLAGGVGWLIADRVRDVKRPVARSVVIGMAAGIVATMPGAVTVVFPWNVFVGLLAGALGSLAHSSKGSALAGLATRWGLVVLTASGVGFLAPAIAGDTLGILFSAHLDVLSVPVVSFVGVCLLSLLVSAPAWVLLRRHASRDRVPLAIQTDDGVPES